MPERAARAATIDVLRLPLLAKANGITSRLPILALPVLGPTSLLQIILTARVML